MTGSAVLRRQRSQVPEKGENLVPKVQFISIHLYTVHFPHLLVSVCLMRTRAPTKVRKILSKNFGKEAKMFRGFERKYGKCPAFDLALLDNPTSTAESIPVRQFWLRRDILGIQFPWFFKLVHWDSVHVNLSIAQSNAQPRIVAQSAYNFIFEDSNSSSLTVLASFEK